MKLDLRFTARPLKDLWCQIVVAFLFQSPIVKGEEVSGLDTKTSEHLVHLWERGFWTGSRGDSLLVASQDMVKAEKILLEGLGDRTDYNIEVLAVRVRETGRTLERMAVDDIGIHIPMAEELQEEYPSQLETACVHLVESFLALHKGEPGFLLKIVVCMGDLFDDGLESAVCRLREHFKGRLDYSVILDG